ncbi:YycH protein [Geomicrobium sp. JCM 19037]|uniref:YycH family regulatory protein n=1 Tax=unclassified Geomicrobium TaxID=2628951 RepID=UPI00045F2191|nr:two-component system activity regulator YycH [Geomicrobium sp. JCM 19037]GAK03408.1 YycH protein [Geomicrobium sp. JCM 19037]
MTERIKSGVLIVLILSSLLLTWQLWTYQPNLEVLDEGGYTTESIGETAATDDIIKPANIIYHVEDERFMTYGNNSIETERLLDDLNSHGQSDFEVIENPNSSLDLYPDTDFIELSFPTGIPPELVQQLLNEDADLLMDTDTSFERIILYENQEDTVIRYLSFDGEESVEARVNINPSVFRSNYLYNYEVDNVYPVYSELAGGTGERLDKPLYLPIEPVYYTNRSYEIETSDYISPAAFEPLLFDEEPIPVSEQSIYIGSSQQMTVSSNNDFLEFTDVTVPVTQSENPDQIVQDAINYVNLHGGFTEKYQLYGYGSDRANVEEDEYARFRLVEDGVPVLDSSNDGYINVMRSYNEVISNYTRPLYTLGRFQSELASSEQLPHGERVWESIGEDREEITDVRVGYTIHREQGITETISFEPEWYVLLNNVWQPIDFGSEEDSYGLE